MMNITKEQVVIGGRTFPAEVFRTSTSSNNWIGLLEGLGELGNPDGSQLDKLNLLDGAGKPASWSAQAAKAGFDFPFNMIEVQIPPTWDYWAIKDSFAIYLKETLKADVIGIGGYSLGGRGTWACLQGDSKKYINFIFSICGYYDAALGPISNLRAVPGYSVHGDKDPTMNYKWDFDTIQAYNVGKPTQKVNGVDQPCHYLKTIPGAAHNVWSIAFDVTPGKDGLLQWVIQQFNSVIPVVPPITINDAVTQSYSDGKQMVFVLASGKTVYSPIIPSL